MNKKVIIIAEAGVNHNGCIENAKKLIDIASDAGADYVKFQSFSADRLVSKVAEKAKYQKQNLGGLDNTQYSMLKKLELSKKDHSVLISHCKIKKIKFLSTAFDIQGIDFLDTLNLDCYKIPSGEINNYPYLRQISKKNKPVIISTGMANMYEINSAIEILTKYGLSKDKITVLHCNTEYPTPMEDVNLKAMLTIGKEFNTKVGYSDHTLGIEVAISAVALGASVIEKHFTINRDMPGPDHKASLTPNELKDMVLSIRNIEKAISGDGKKYPSKSELKNINIARKSIHLTRDMEKGSVITEKDIIPLRPGSGLNPMLWNSTIGKKVNKNMKSNDILMPEDLI